MKAESNDWKHVVALVCVSAVIIVFTVFVASQTSQYPLGQQSVWEDAVAAGVAEIVESKVPNASGYVSREYRWKKCQ
jgi:uncharacterized membrane protein